MSSSTKFGFLVGIRLVDVFHSSTYKYIYIYTHILNLCISNFNPTSNDPVSLLKKAKLRKLQKVISLLRGTCFWTRGKFFRQLIQYLSFHIPDLNQFDCIYLAYLNGVNFSLTGLNNFLRSQCSAQDITAQCTVITTKPINNYCQLTQVQRP